MGSGNFLPTLSERLTPSIARFDRQVAAIMQMLRVSLPAIVQAVNVGPPLTVDVLVPTNEYQTQNTGGDDISIATQAKQLPLFSGVPVMWPQGGGWNLTFPIQENDECLLVFSDTMLDWWFQNGGLNNIPTSPRRHSLSDPIALFGIRSTPRALSDYSTDSTQLRSDDQTVVIDLATDGITITAPAVTVNTSGDVEVNASGDVTVEASGEVTITGTPNVSVGSHTTIDSRVFLNHSHSGVTTGGGVTGGVV